MATNTFEAFYLGVFADIDVNEADLVADNASSLVGLSFGGVDDPLYNSIDQLTTNDADNDTYIRTNSGGQTGEDLTYNRVTSTFDGISTYNATITYSDGTTASAEIVIMQDESGRTFWAPWMAGHANNTPLGTKPIMSVTIDSVASDATIGSSVTQENDAFLDGTVDGTSGNDAIGTSFTDAGGTQMNAYGGDDTVDAGAGDDTVLGGAGNDVIDAGTGNDLVDGGIGNDSVRTGDGADTVLGDAGNDTIAGGAGADSLIGGTGTDMLDYSASGTGVNINLSTNTASGGDATGDTISGFEAVTGSAFNDTLTGSANADSLIGGAGNDTIDGGAGNDTIDGGAGADTLFSGGGSDSVLGGDGDDFFDATTSASGNDTLLGGAGNDTIQHSISDRIVDGGDDDDYIVNVRGTQFASNSTITGGAGTDTYALDSSEGGGFNPLHVVNLSIGQVTYNGALRDFITDFENVSIINASAGVIGDAGANVITATGNFANNLQGGAGNDTIDGGDGNDSIAGGAGADSLTGGTGTDTLDYSTSGVGVDVNLGTGAASRGDAAGDTISGFEAVTGSASRDTLTGFSGDDTLDGGAGNDALISSAGNDVIIGGAGGDRYDVLDGFGNDTVDLGTEEITIDSAFAREYINFYDVSSAVTITYTGSGGTATDGTNTITFDNVDGWEAALMAGGTLDARLATFDVVYYDYGGATTAYGSAFNDMIAAFGADASNRFYDGGAGDDYLDTGDGNDTILGGDGNDTITSRDGADSVDGGAGNDSISDGAGNSTLLGGTGNDTITNSGGNDVLDGGAGNDSITGTAGDTLIGGDGDDTLTALSNGSWTSFQIDNDDGNDVLIGYEGVGDNVDNLIFGATTSSDGVTVTLTTGEGGSYTYNGVSGTGSGTFSGFERIDGTDNADVFDASAVTADTFGLGSYFNIYTNGGDDLVLGSAFDDGFTLGDGNNTVYGGAGDDYIESNATSGAELMDGGSGNDSIYLIGSTGTATVDGGTGNDFVYWGGNDVTYVLQDGFGTDTLRAEFDTFDGAAGDGIDASALTNGVTVSFTADQDGTLVEGANSVTFENLEFFTLTDQGDSFDGTGSVLARDIGGDGGDDTLTGGIGSDTLTGGDGNDTLIGDGVTIVRPDAFISEIDYVGAGEATDDEFVEITVLASRDLSEFTVSFYDGADATSPTLNASSPSSFITGSEVTLQQLLDLTGGVLPTAGSPVSLPSGVGGLDLTVYSHPDNPDYLIFQLPANLTDEDATDDQARVVALTDTANATVLDAYDLGLSEGFGTLSGGAADGATPTLAVHAWLNNTVTISESGNATRVDGGTLGNSELYGVLYDDVLDGGVGNDSILGGVGNDTLTGGLGNDTLEGGDGDDLIDGGAGDDFLTTGLGRDTLIGGTGNDTLMNSAGDDSLVGGEGDDLIIATGGNDTLEGGSGNDTLDGGADNDSLLGGSGNDVLKGGTGDDFQDGGDDADTFILENTFGNDTIIGGEGGNDSDTINGSALTGNITVTFTGSEAGTLTDGTDTIGFSQIENVFTGDGNDLLDASADSSGVGLFGGRGNDTIIGGSGNDFISGGEGADSIRGGGGPDTIFGGTGDDTISGGQGNDSIEGGDGSDVVVVEDGFGNDTIIGGEGGTDFDTIDLSNLTGPVTVTYDSVGAESGTITDGIGTITFSEIERIILTDQADSVDGSASHDGLFGDAPGINVDGRAGNDTIVGGRGGDTIDGGTGNDSIIGNYGDDSLTGGAGNDTLFGDETNGSGGGNDTIDGGDGDDFIDGGVQADTLRGGAGNDTLIGGSGNDSIDGGAGADSIEGGSGNDTIFASFGNDTITGGAGADSLEGGDDADTFIVQDGFGTDTIVGGEGGIDDDTIDLSALTGPVTVTYTGNEAGTITDGIDTITFSEIERVILTDQNDSLNGNADSVGLDVAAGNGDDTVQGGAGADSIDGGAGNDSIAAGSGNDTVQGGDGSDTIDASFGNDSIEGGAGNDTLWGSAGNDTLRGGSENDSLHGGNNDDVLDGGTGNDRLEGGNGNDGLAGGAGNDTLIGGADNDTLDGGTGNDLLTGGTGNDTFTYAPGDGLDTITDFNTGNTGALGDGDTTNNDFINLGNFYDDINELRNDFEDDGVLNQSNSTVNGGSVDYSNNDQFASGEGVAFQGSSRESFTTDNTGVVCFTEGTAIRTPLGDVLIEELRVGDLVCTVDNGPQRIRWIGRRSLDHATLRAHPNMRPVLLEQGVLGCERRLLVSPQHGLVMGRAGDTLVRAKHLAGAMQGVRIAHGRRQVTYIHLMFEAHQIILAENIPSESFYPGPMALQMIDATRRKELFALLPEIAACQHDRDALAQIYGVTARGFVKRKHAIELMRNEA